MESGEGMSLDSGHFSQRFEARRWPSIGTSKVVAAEREEPLFVVSVGLTLVVDPLRA